MVPTPPARCSYALPPIMAHLKAYGLPQPGERPLRRQLVGVRQYRQYQKYGCCYTIGMVAAHRIGLGFKVAAHALGATDVESS